MPDIFISYTREDESFITDLYEAFLKHSLSVWIDWKLSIPSLTQWDAIKQNIAIAKYFIIVISPYSMSSPLCHLQIEYASSLNKHIIPILYADYERDNCIKDIVQQISIFRHIWGTRKSIEVFDKNLQILTSANYLKFDLNDNFSIKFEQLMGIIGTPPNQVKYNQPQPAQFLTVIQKKSTNMSERRNQLWRLVFFVFLFIVASLLKSLIENPSNTNAIDAYNRGTDYLELGNYNRAIVEFNEALKLDSQLAEAYYNRGLAYLNIENANKALADFNRAIELNPQLAEAYSLRAVLYDQLGEYEQALSDANHAIELNPEFAEAYYNRGLVYFHLGNAEEALLDINRAIELNPQLEEAYNNRAILYGQLGDYEQALSDANHAIELNPQLAEAYLNRGVAYANLEVTDKALADFNHTIELNPDSYQAYVNRSWVYLTLGDYEQVIADTNHAIELNPQLAEAYNNRGLAYYLLAYTETNSRQKKEYQRQSLADFQKAQLLGLALKPEAMEIVTELEDIVEPLEPTLTPTPTLIILVPTGEAESAQK